MSTRTEVDRMTRRTKHLKWVGATVVTALALAAPAPAAAGSGSASSPATAVYGAARGDHTQERSDATGRRGGLDRGDAALAVAMLAGVLLIGRWGYVVVGALIAVVASLPAGAARIAAGKPGRAPGWADWPGTDLPDARRQTTRHRPRVRGAETELR
jgi:hypothetical protein